MKDNNEEDNDKDVSLDLSSAQVIEGEPGFVILFSGYQKYFIKNEIRKRS